MSPSTGSSLQLTRPKFLGIDFNQEDRYYWLCLAVLIVVGAMVHRLRRTGPGRCMIAVRDNEPSAASLSLSPWRVKLTAFVLSGAIASLAGFLYAGLLINFSSNPDVTFGPDVSLSLVVICVFGGITSITGVVLGALWLEGIPQLLGQGYALLSSGIAVVFILLLLPGGLASLVFDLRDRLVVRLVPCRAGPVEAEDIDTTETAGTIHAALVRGATARPTAVAARADGPSDGAGDPEAAPLRADDVSVRFGGLQALRGVSIVAQPGEIVGLMGPNGAGKTTLFDVLSGNLRPASGRVVLEGRDVTRLPPNRRARLGIGRTYQQARLFGDLTVLECVEIALERHRRSRLLPSMAGWPGATRAERARGTRAAEVLDLLDLSEYADRPVAELPTGLRRMAELACVIALEPSVLLLDEPTAGFTPRETAAFGGIIHDVRRYLGATVIVIDHDVPMMRHLVDRLYVLAVGEVIAQGPPSLLDSDDNVAEVYLGGRFSERNPGRRVSAAPAPARPRAVAP